MKKIQYDKFGQQDPPIFILSTVWHHHLGTITNIDSSTINEKWNMNSADEISFDVYKNVDGTDYELWDSLKSFKYVYVPSHDAYYKIDVAIDESNKTVKHITGTAAGEFELSNRIIVDLQINTNVDIEERDQDESDGVDGVIFYNPEKPGFSLLDLVLKDKAPDWSIAHVDASLCNVQRTYTFSNQTIYDALTNTIATETQCLFTFDSVNRTISAYDLLNYCDATVTDSHGNQHVCGYRTEYNTCPKCGNAHLVPSYGTNTHIYISPENFAESITIDGNESNVKNCFKISGGDENMTAAVINCNPAGSAYIYDFSEDDYADMPQELVDRLNQYYEDYEAAKPSREEKATELYNAWTQYYYYRDSMMPRASADHWQADYEGYNVNDTCYVITLPSSYHLKCVRVEGEGKTGHIEFDATEAIEGDQYVDNDITWEVVMNTVGDLPTAEQVLHDAERFITDVNHKVFYEDTPISDASVRLAIKNLIAANINPLFNVDLSDGTVLPDQAHRTSGTSVITWTGKLTIVNTTKQDDVRTSSTDQTATLKKASSVQEHEQYMYDLTKKRLDRADTAFTDLYALPIPYKTEGTPPREVYDEAADTDFRALVKEYSLNLLDGFYKSYTACREVLITNGVTESTPTFHGADLYQKFYIPYNKRMEYIDAEMKVRQEQVYSLYIDPKEPNYDPNNKPIINQIKDWMDAQNAIFNLRTYLGEDLYAIFCHYRKESAYQNSNYISTGLSDNVLILRARELFDKATEELAKAKELQISLSTSLGNLLNTKEFENYKDKFEIGDYLMCRADDVLYKIRLMEVDISYNDPKSINVTFSNVTKSKTFMSDVQDVLSQAKSISSSYTSTTRQVEQNSRAASTVYDWTKEGLSSALVKIMNNNHEEITYDENGIIARQYNDVEDAYDPHQLRITHDQIIFTENNWEDASFSLGLNQHRYVENGMVHDDGLDYGSISNFVTAGTVDGADIIGGNIYSSNYNITGTKPIGSHINLDTGTFELAGGRLKAVYDDTTNVYSVELDGTIKATDGEIGGWTIDSDRLYKREEEIIPSYGTNWKETTLEPDKLSFETYDSINVGYHELTVSPLGIKAYSGTTKQTSNPVFNFDFDQVGLQVLDVVKMPEGGGVDNWGNITNYSNGFSYSLNETLAGILYEGYKVGTYTNERFIGVTGIVTSQILNLWIPFKLNSDSDPTISITSCKIYWNSSIWGAEEASHIAIVHKYRKQGMVALQFDTNFGVADYTPFVGFVDLSFTIT